LSQSKRGSRDEGRSSARIQNAVEFGGSSSSTPDVDEVLIAVEVCGVCHSDLHVADGDWPQLARIVKKPLILGHEIIGRVIERGAAVQSVAIGERVGIPWVQYTCGECEFCHEAMRICALANASPASPSMADTRNMRRLPPATSQKFRMRFRPTKPPRSFVPVSPSIAPSSKPKFAPASVWQFSVLAD